MISPDSSTPKAISRVLEHIESDKKIKDYYEVIRQSAELVQNYRALQSSDIATLSSIKYFPSQVAQSETGKFGFLELIDSFYCISKKTLTIWDREDPTIINTIEEEADEILAVTCFIPDHKLISKTVPCMLALSTPYYIKVYPFIDAQLNTEIFYTVETNFAAFSLSEGPDHSFYAGSHNGSVFALRFCRQGSLLEKIFEPDAIIQQSVQLKIYNATDTIIDQVRPEFTKLRESAIIQMVFCPTTNYLAVLDDYSSIKFYKTGTLFHSFKLSKVGSYSSGNSPIVSISPISSSESDVMRFVAFTTRGQRLFFGHSKIVFFYNKSISLQYIKEPPPDVPPGQLIHGAYTLNTSVLVYPTGLFVIRSSTNLVAEEVFTPDILQCSGILCFPLRHPLDFLPQNALFKDPSMWTHVFQPPKFVVIATQGTYTVSPAMYVENLYRCLCESHGGITRDTFLILGSDKLLNESLAGALEFAQNRPESKIYVKQAFTLLKGKGASLSEAIFIRAARYVGLIFSLVPLTDDRISKAITKLPSNFTQQILGFVDIINELTPSESDLSEQSDLSELSEFLTVLQEIVHFLQLIGTQEKTAVKTATSKLSYSDLRVLRKPIGESQVETIVECLRHFIPEFVAALQQSKELDLLCAQICRECPHITSYEQTIFIGAEELLNEASCAHPDERRIILRKACNAFLDVIASHKSSESKIQELDLTFQVRRFFDLGEPAMGVEIAECWRRATDPSNLALDWFDRYCDQSDFSGFQAFQRVYKCYNSAIAAADSDEGLHAILMTGDKLFIFTALEHISSDEKRLLSVDSPFLEEYIRNNKHNLLSQLNARTNKQKAV